MSYRYYIILIIYFVSVSGINAGNNIQTDAGLHLFKPVGSFEIKNATLFDAIIKLCRENQIRICKESKNYNPIRFSAKYKNITVQEILTELIKRDPTYFWEYSRTGMLNILPRSTTLGTYDLSVLDWSIPRLLVVTTKADFILSPQHYFGQWLRDNGIEIDWHSTTTQSDFADKLITINLPPATARDALNTMVRSAGPSYIWHLYWKDNKPYIRFKKIF